MSHVESLDAAKSKGPENFFFIKSILTNSRSSCPYRIKRVEIQNHMSRVSLSLLDITYWI